MIQEKQRAFSAIGKSEQRGGILEPWGETFRRGGAFWGKGGLRERKRNHPHQTQVWTLQSSRFSLFTVFLSLLLLIYFFSSIMLIGNGQWVICLF